MAFILIVLERTPKLAIQLDIFYIHAHSADNSVYLSSYITKQNNVMETEVELQLILLACHVKTSGWGIPVWPTRHVIVGILPHNPSHLFQTKVL